MKVDTTTDVQRRFAVGAEVQPGGVHFRVWAPRRRKVEAVFEGGRPAALLAGEPGGYFSGRVEGAVAGERYRFRLDGGDAFPDPASRFQPQGPHGPSEVVDSKFPWTDQAWRGLAREGQVLYEMHVGTFTREGTYAAAARELPRLRELGITALELMPLADFPGRFGWGYDGVDLFAPTRLYGRPEDLRRLVDEAHRLGLGVILDVVYNHFGPAGNYLPQYSDTWFNPGRQGEWGDPINYEGAGSAGVREFVIENAAYWIDEFHFDGLRLDATQGIFDDSPEHVIAALARRARQAAGARSLFLVAENEPQETRLVRAPAQGGYGLDALWNDDFHHSAMVALTGIREAYYNDHRGRAQELLAAVKYGYLYQGQYYAWQKQRRGTPALDLPRAAFVHFLENHDQVANYACGTRVHQLTSPGRYRALTALLLLGPATPMLFQGQEYGASQRFHFFADHEPELAARVREGRREFLTQFPSAAGPGMEESLPDPDSEQTFAECRLDHAQREQGRHAQAWALHADLLRLRRQDPLLSGRARFDGAVLDEQAFLLRFFAPDGDDRLLIVNLGPELRLDVAPEPLLAPPAGACWRTAWSSADPRYGGCGAWEPETGEGWRIQGEAAMVLRPAPRPPSPKPE
ncbi:MAG TPA: malto-oligosyltrehalose trehalohydrolase [Vicinamibacteria bacterium]|nr:malto-oligosyltrehalose trehalohydrolase [Vicinamibacteria bacterium]